MSGEVLQNNKNTIKVQVKKEKNVISYDCEVTGDWKKFFRFKKQFFVEYETNIEHCPDSIAIIPILSVLLPVSWVEDGKIIIDEIDEDFLECIDIVKRNYAFMMPEYNYKGSLQYNKVVKNNIDYMANKTLCLFSGGVDATATLINNVKSKPTLLTIWGTDVPLERADTWEMVKKNVGTTAKDFNLPITYVKTAFRYMLNEFELTKKYRDWWHDFQHGIGLLGQVAPYAYLNNFNNVVIASSYSAKDGFVGKCASMPFIDENVKYAGCRIFHDSFQMSRLDKIRSIYEYSIKHKQKFNLRVCWQQLEEENCCTCEKCARTIFGLYAVGAKPENFGFNITKEKEDKLIENLHNGKIQVNWFWNDLYTILKLSTLYYKDNRLVQELLKCNLNVPLINNFSRTIFIKDSK